MKKGSLGPGVHDNLTCQEYFGMDNVDQEWL